MVEWNVAMKKLVVGQYLLKISILVLKSLQLYYVMNEHVYVVNAHML